MSDEASLVGGDECDFPIKAVVLAEMSECRIDHSLTLQVSAPPSRVLSLAEPNFVGSYEVGEYVMFFFRETAVEYINCGKNVYSRVARVCKKDTGGKNILVQNWATYLKARLNCSIPGEFPFYFNEIRE